MYTGKVVVRPTYTTPYYNVWQSERIPFYKREDLYAYLYLMGYQPCEHVTHLDARNWIMPPPHPDEVLGFGVTVSTRPGLIRVQRMINYTFILCRTPDAKRLFTNAQG